MWANNTANSASITLALKWMICSAIFHSLNQKSTFSLAIMDTIPHKDRKKDNDENATQI